jgi:ABC-type glycerol-3-phosphate transport system substrate-binding protein
VADAMRDESQINDEYAQKFGANRDGLSDGKILVANQSTWDDSWLNTQLTGFKWDYYPIPAPSADKARQIVHADYGFMLSTAKAPEAAWEFLKYLTFGKDGLSTRMALQNRLNESAATNNRFTIPASSHPDIAALFNDSPNVPGGIKYMYNHMDKSVKGDYSKILPDYWKIVNDNLYQAKESIKNGTDAAAVARETEEKINKDFTAAYDTFSVLVKDVQKRFEDSRDSGT